MHKLVNMPNKTDAGNGSHGICRVIADSRSPSLDTSRYMEAAANDDVPATSIF
jgi:hypothetical protein